MKSARIAIIGFGVIGRGFAEALLQKKKYLKELGVDLSVIAVCEVDGSLVNEKGIDLKKALKGELKKQSDWDSIKAPAVIDKHKPDIVLELTPGNVKDGEPGLGHIRKALGSGINVVTSNKAPLALNYSELMSLAEDNNVKLKFEATVGGAIPIINLYRNSLKINEIRSIYGILNGTSNFVLSKMDEEAIGLDDAVKEAQELGIAESDPGYDIDGIDTAVKVAILANSLMNQKVSFRDIKVKGIRDVTPEAIELARKQGYSIKLIGDVGNLEVSPRLVPKGDPLDVSGSLNAVMLDTDMARDITIVGRGAGAIETASSLLSDVLEIVG